MKCSVGICELTYRKSGSQLSCVLFQDKIVFVRFDRIVLLYSFAFHETTINCTFVM